MNLNFVGALRTHSTVKRRLSAMNSSVSIHHSLQFHPHNAFARTTAQNVLNIYLDGGDWFCALGLLARPQDIQAVKELESLLDCINREQSDLEHAVMEHLKSFDSRSEGWKAAQLIVIPTADRILAAFKDANLCDDKSSWARTMDRLVQGNHDNAVNVLQVLVKKGMPPELASKAKECLNAVRDDPTTANSVARQIDGILGEERPLRKDDRHTASDGDCLIHAMLGTLENGKFQCTPQDVVSWRAALSDGLRKCVAGAQQLPSSLEASASAFFDELKELAFLGGVVPNRATMEMAVKSLNIIDFDMDVSFASLSQAERGRVLDTFADLVALSGFYLPYGMAPLLAEVSGKSIQMHLDGEGWQDHNAGGESSSRASGVVAIRFNAKKQHFERVEAATDSESTQGSLRGLSSGPLPGAVPDPDNDDPVSRGASIPQRIRASDREGKGLHRLSPAAITVETQNPESTQLAVQAPVAQKSFWDRLMDRINDWLSRLFDWFL